MNPARHMPLRGAARKSDLRKVIDATLDLILRFQEIVTIVLIQCNNKSLNLTFWFVFCCSTSRLLRTLFESLRPSALARFGKTIHYWRRRQIPLFPNTTVLTLVYRAFT